MGRAKGAGLCVMLVSWSALCAAAVAEAAAELPPADVSPLRWTPEQTITGFRQMERIFETRRIEAGERALELREGDAIEVEFELEGRRYDTERYMAEHRLTGVLVVQDGEILLERYAHDRGPQDLWASFSMAKSVTSTLVGAAIADGHIDSLDDPLSRYLPETAGTDYGDVALRHLLSMSSGIDWDEDYGDPESDIGRVYDTPSSEPGVNPVIDYMRQLPRAHPPGEQFNYNTGETDLVGYVVSRATGKTLSAYLEEKIWQPLGMERDAVWQLDDEGHERGGCCMAVTLRDYARFGLFMLQGGRADGEAVLPEGWVERATGNRLSEPFPDGNGYGYFWWTQADGGYQAIGIYGQLIHVVPEEALVIVTNAAWPSTGGPELSAARAAFVEAVRSAVNSSSEKAR